MNQTARQTQGQHENRFLRKPRTPFFARIFVLSLALLLLFCGCSEKQPVVPNQTTAESDTETTTPETETVEQLVYQKEPNFKRSVKALSFQCDSSFGLDEDFVLPIQVLNAFPFPKNEKQQPRKVPHDVVLRVQMSGFSAKNEPNETICVEMPGEFERYFTREELLTNSETYTDVPVIIHEDHLQEGDTGEIQISLIVYLDPSEPYNYFIESFSMSYKVEDQMVNLERNWLMRGDPDYPVLTPDIVF